MRIAGDGLLKWANELQNTHTHTSSTTEKPTNAEDEIIERRVEKTYLSLFLRQLEVSSRPPSPDWRCHILPHLSKVRLGPDLFLLSTSFYVFGF